MRKKDLLRSFSKVHNRKLVLLEQDTELDDSLQQRVVVALKKLNSANWTQRTPNSPAWQAEMDTSIGPKTYSFNATTGKITGTPTSFQAIGTFSQGPEGGSGWLQNISESPTAKNPSKQFKQLVGQLVGDTDITKSDTQRAQEEKVRPGAVLDLMDDGIDEETKERIRSNLDAIAREVTNVWNTLGDSQKQAYGNTLERYLSKFVGSSKNSFESKLLKDKLNLKLENGEWVATTMRPDDNQSVFVSESLKDLAQLAGSDTVTDDQCSKILKDFAFQAGTDRIIISPKGDGDDRSSALSFADPQHTYRNMLRLASNKCHPGPTEQSDKKIKVVRVESINPDSEGGDNAARGFAFEDILEVFSLLMIRKQMGMGTDSGNLNTVLANKAVKVGRRLAKLQQDSEMWVENAKLNGLDVEEAQLVQDIARIASDIGDFNSETLFGSMLHHSKNSLLKRKAAFAFPVGTETKRGKRQDVLEIYRTREEAEAAAASMGVSIEPEVFGSLDDALRGTTAIVTEEGEQIKLSQALEESGAFTPGQEVFTLKVSLKNYLKFEGHGALMGGGMKSTFQTLTDTRDGQFVEPFMQKIQDIAKIEDVSRFKEYADKMQSIDTGVDNIGQKAFLTTAGGIRRNNLKDLKSSVNRTFRENNIDVTRAGRRLESMFDTLTRRSRTAPGTADANYAKAREYTKRFVENTKIVNDLGSDNEQTRRTAKQYLAAKMLHAGGSDDDETLCDYRGLNTGDDYIFKQNDPLREAWESVLAEDGKWRLAISEDGVGFSLNHSDSDASIAFETAIVASKSDGQIADWKSQFKTRMNLGALKYFNRLKGKKNESKVDEAFKHIMIALSLLQEKVSVLNA